MRELCCARLDSKRSKTWERCHLLLELRLRNLVAPDRTCESWTRPHSSPPRHVYAWLGRSAQPIARPGEVTRIASEAAAFLGLG